MTNFQVYKKTLSFSLINFLVSLASLLVVALFCTAFFFIFNAASDMGVVGLIVGFVLGIIAAALINFFINNRIKAAQVAMMTKGVTEDALPDHTFKEGFVEIKGRFGKIAVFFVITNAIKGIFRQLGRGLNKIGTVVGGQVGNSVTSAIDSAIQILIGYLCDCCLGWILFRKDQNSFKAGCEGSVIFFKHGKTLIRNIGRIFGMGILSFIVLAGGLTVLFYLINANLPGMFNALANEMVEIGTRTGTEMAEFLTDSKMLGLMVAVVAGIMLWGIIHSVFIRPFILVGVLRNFMVAGQQDLPKEEDLQALSHKSPRFAKLYSKI